MKNTFTKRLREINNYAAKWGHKVEVDNGVVEGKAFMKVSKDMTYVTTFDALDFSTYKPHGVWVKDGKLILKFAL